MGTVVIKTQCCLLKGEDDDWEEDDEAGGAQEGTAVQLVDPTPWQGRPDAGPPGAPVRTQAAMPRSLSDATTIFPSRG